MGCASQEAWWILGKERFEGGCHDVGKLVLLDSIPHVEEKHSPCLKNSARFRESFGFVGKEHYPKLADNGVKLLVLEGQLHGICLTPRHRALRANLGGHVQHGLIQVRSDNRHFFRQQGCKPTGQDTGAGGNFKHTSRRSCRKAIGKVFSVRLKDQRYKQLFIQLRNGACEVSV